MIDQESSGRKKGKILSMRSFWLGFLLLISACVPSGEVALQAIETVAIPPTESGLNWLSLYFSEPESPSAGTYRGGPDAALAAAIDRAEISVDAAIHDLNLWSLRDALLDADRRGVDVRLIFETGNLDSRSEMQELASQVDFIEDDSEGRMHHKFMVIDGLQVWTGSMNFTTTGAYRNRNHLIRIESEALAAQYTAEFEEMFIAGDFGIDSPTSSGFLTSIQGHSVEVYFSPDDSTLERLLELVNGAADTIDFLAFSFTADELAEALLAAEKRGVRVRGVFEGSQAISNTGGEWAYLESAGLNIRQDGQPGQMHHKVLVIDGAIVVLGSYNFSRSAEERNDENTLVIASQELAAEFEAEFEEIWELAE